jgi:hypothetical protein
MLTTLVERPRSDYRGRLKEYGSSVEADDDPAFHRHRAATQACARPEEQTGCGIHSQRERFARPVLSSAENDNVGPVFEEGESVAFVDEEIGFSSVTPGAPSICRSLLMTSFHFLFSCSFNDPDLFFTILISG